MPPLTLYRAGANGRLALTGLVQEGDHFSAHVNDDGSITLSKVDIVTTAGNRRPGPGDSDGEPYAQV